MFENLDRFPSDPTPLRFVWPALDPWKYGPDCMEESKRGMEDADDTKEEDDANS